VLVCHCEVVSDREVHAAIAAGARDEFDVAEACGAGGACGGCLDAISDILEERGCASGCPIGLLKATRVPAGTRTEVAA
jgi:bacterioferritin-associated ferredoxin